MIKGFVINSTSWHLNLNCSSLWYRTYENYHINYWHLKSDLIYPLSITSFKPHLMWLFLCGYFCLFLFLFFYFLRLSTTDHDKNPRINCRWTNKGKSESLVVKSWVEIPKGRKKQYQKAKNLSSFPPIDHSFSQGNPVTHHVGIKDVEDDLDKSSLLLHKRYALSSLYYSCFLQQLLCILSFPIFKA